MSRKIIKTVAVAVLVSVFSAAVPASYASETEYAPTSSLNKGWDGRSYTERTLVAAASFGEEPEMLHMQAEIGDDPQSVEVSSTMGREGWVITPNKGENARYININIDKDAAYNITDGTSYALEVDYYDAGISSVALEYESMDYQDYSSSYTKTETAVLNKKATKSEGEYLVFKNTGMWQTYTWFMPNPKFSDALDGNDLRIGIYSDTMLYSRGGEVVIGAVRLYRLSTKSLIKMTADTEENIGNIFFEGDEIKLTTTLSKSLYQLSAPLGSKCPTDIYYTVRDEDGKIVWTGSDKKTLNGFSETKSSVKFKVDKFGIYRYDVEAVSAEQGIYSLLGAEFSYVRSDKGKTVNPSVGVQIAMVNPEDYRVARLARYAGIPNTRMMLYYNNFRKSADKYEITNVAVAESFKSLFRAFKKNGLEIDANLHSASWMGAAYNFSATERTPPYTEEGLRRWADYCSQMALLLGDTVDQMEVWNEYNLGPNHSFNRENRPASDYAKLYDVSKRAIKAVNPDMPVIGLNTSGAPLAWIEEVLQNAEEKMDVFSVHPYQWYGDPLTYNCVEKNLKPLKELFEKYGMGDVPIWMTEYGYSSHYESVNTDMQQGLYTVQAYSLVMASEIVDRYYIYCFLDLPNNKRADRETNFGLLRDRINNPIPYMTPYAAKPAYLMVSNMNRMYSDAEFAEQMNLGDSGVIIRSVHKTDGKQFAVMFSNKADGESVTLDLGTDKIDVYDAYGNKSEMTGTNGVYSFSLSERVIYIEGDFKKFEKTESGIYPKCVNVEKVYGETADLEIVNEQGKNITVMLEPLEKSGLQPFEKATSETNVTAEISGGNAVSGTERMRLVIKDGSKVYFSGDIFVNFRGAAELSTTLLAKQDGWAFACTIVNMSQKNEISGKLKILTPKTWNLADTALTLAPAETKTVEIKLPVAMSADEQVIEAGFVTDSESGMGSYTSRSYNFCAAEHALTPITIDGSGDEWTSGFMTLSRNDQFKSLLSLGSSYSGPEDLSVSAAVKWDKDNFYFYADVLDNIHFSTGVDPVNIWQMDSIQIALVYDPEDKLEKSQFEEFAIGEIDGKPVLYRHKTRFKGDGDFTQIPGSELAVVCKGTHTYYELKIPWESLMTEKTEIKPGTELKFAMVVNENDGVGRVGYMAFGDGIVSSKNSTLFKRLYIRE